MQTSKKILWISYIIGIVLTIITVIGVFMGFDVMVLGTVTGLSYGEISVSNAFYFNKAKKENALKIAFGCSDLSPEKAEKVARLMEVIGGIV
ncbi:MAG: hypothetical protein OSJ46_11685 [Duncaniella sp.]|uniref:hypothetical protein n=1 Tax=uncultured Alistipes sp. TaxID=538949 RepID=UPI00321FF339|nr:hypothetical protein [Duncaniella sp.]